MTVKNLLLLTFVCVLSITKAQNPDNKMLLEGFDEKAAIKELKKKGLNPNEYLGEAKRVYMVKKAKEIGYKSKTNAVPHNHSSNTKYINLNTQVTSTCPNSDFSSVNLTNWTGGIWALPSAGINTWLMTPSWTTGNYGNLNDFLDYGGAGTAPASIPTPNRQVILTTPPTNNNPASGPVIGYDSLAINPGTNLADIPLQPPGSTTALRLGNANIGDGFSSEAETEQIVYSMNVSASTTQFTYQYAVVLNNPGSGTHASDEQPFFEITVKDQTGTQIGGPCGKYLVTTDLANDTSYHFIHQTGSTYNDFIDIYYKNWTTVTVDLSAQMGQNITIEFRTADCSRTGHFGYAYLNAFCGSLVGTASGLCGGVGTAVLTAPPGFSSYQWYGPPNGTVLIPGATASTYTATSVNVGDTFSVHMISPAGCNSTIKIGITGSNIVATYSSSPSCRMGSTGSVTAGIAGGGNFSYTWTNSVGTNIGNTSTVNNLPLGTYSVHIVDNTGTCPPKDSTIKVLDLPPVLTYTTSQLCGTVLAPQLQVPAGAITPYSWTMNGTTTVISTAATLVYTASVSPTDYFVVTYKDPATGCEDSLKTTLNQVDIGFTTSQTNPCNGGNNGSITLTPVTTNTYTSFDWSILPNPASATLTPSGTGGPPLVAAGLTDPPHSGTSYTVSINVTGNTSCIYTVSVILNDGALPPPSLENLKGCALDNVSVPSFTVPGYTHSWYTGTTSLGGTYPYVTSGVTANVVYTDTMRDVNGCISIYKGTIKLESIIASISTPELIKCPGDSTGSIKVNVTSETNGPIGGTYTFTWDYPSPYTDPPVVVKGTTPPQSSTQTDLHAGFYSVLIKSGNCVLTKTITLVNPAPLVDDTLNLFYCPKDDSALIVATEKGHPSYTWLLNHVVVPGKNNDSIWVNVSDVNSYLAAYLDNGCKDTASVLLTFPSWHALRPDTLVNIFTPNGDNRNDIFFPFHCKNASEHEIDKQAEYYSIFIYNRWGKLVFESERYNAGWNGVEKGSNNPADDGTYYFVVKYKSNCSTKADIVTKKGFVQILR